MSNSDITYQWPADFPEGLPESQDVVPANGRVCRLVDCVPPNDKDFKRHRDEKPDYTYNTEKNAFNLTVFHFGHQKMLQNQSKPNILLRSSLVSKKLFLVSWCRNWVLFQNKLHVMVILLYGNN